MTETLSPQERKLFPLLTQDLQSKEIAFRLGLHEKTIATYSKNIYAKVGVLSRLSFLIWYYTTVNTVEGDWKIKKLLS